MFSTQGKWRAYYVSKKARICVWIPEHVIAVIFFLETVFSECHIQTLARFKIDRITGQPSHAVSGYIIRTLGVIAHVGCGSHIAVFINRFMSARLKKYCIA